MGGNIFTVVLVDGNVVSCLGCYFLLSARFQIVIQKKEYDEKADVYSFAIILWEVRQVHMLMYLSINQCGCIKQIHTRQFPFDEFSIKWAYQLEDKISGGLRPIIPSSCPAPYSALIVKCWVCGAGCCVLFVIALTLYFI